MFYILLITAGLCNAAGNLPILGRLMGGKAVFEPEKIPSAGQFCELSSYSFNMSNSICKHDRAAPMTYNRPFMCSLAAIKTYSIPLYIEDEVLYTRVVSCYTASYVNGTPWVGPAQSWNSGPTLSCGEVAPLVFPCSLTKLNKGTPSPTQTGSIDFLGGPKGSSDLLDSCYAATVKVPIRNGHKIHCPFGGRGDYRTYHSSDIANASLCQGAGQLFGYNDYLPSLHGSTHSQTHDGLDVLGHSAYLDVNKDTLSEGMIRIMSKQTLLFIKVTRYINCRAADINGKGCHVILEVQEKGTKITLMSPLQSGLLSVQSGQEHGSPTVHSTSCSAGSACALLVPNSDHYRTVCPTGQAVEHYSIRNLYPNCPLSQFSYTRDAAIFVCRATHMPVLFWGSLVFWFLGFYLVQLVVYIAFKLALLAVFGRNLWTGYFRSSSCPICEEIIPNKVVQTAHLFCPDEQCPYCEKHVSLTDLPVHVKRCKRRNPRLLALETDHSEIKDHMRRTKCVRIRTASSFVIWLVVAIILTVVSLKPVQAAEKFGVNTMVPREENSFIDNLIECTKDCLALVDSCLCQDDLSDEPTAADIKDSGTGLGETGRILTTASLFAGHITTNTIRVEDTAWEARTLTGDHVILKGTVRGSVDIKAGVRLVYRIQDKDSSEEKTLQVAIEEVREIYSWDLEYLTTNRRISSWMKGICGGECGDGQTAKCSCGDLPACRATFQSQSSIAGAVPAWCWMINDGCQCCALQAYPVQDTILAVWKPQYERTDLRVCISDTTKTLHCGTISGSGVISAGDYHVGFSSVLGRVEHLGDRVVAAHRVTNGVLSLTSSEIYIKTDQCGPGMCRHGVWGDLQTKNPRYFLEPDSSSKEPNSMTFNFDGVDVAFTRRIANWQRCQLNSIAEELPPFDTINKNWALASTTFKLSSMSKLTSPTPSMSSTLEPLHYAGTSSFSIAMLGVQLTLKSVSPQLTGFSISDCEGCMSCQTGFSCKVTIRKESFHDFLFTVISKTPGVVMAEGAIHVKQNKEHSEVVRGFSAVNISNVELCVKPGELCSKADVTLTAPASLFAIKYSHSMVEANDDCSSLGWFSCVYKGSGNMFSELTSFVKHGTMVLAALLGLSVVLVVIFSLPLRRIKRLMTSLIPIRTRPLAERLLDMRAQSEEIMSLLKEAKGQEGKQS